MPTPKKPRKPAGPPHRKLDGKPRPSPQTQAATEHKTPGQTLAESAFVQLLDAKATPEAIIGMLRAKGLTNEGAAQLLKAVRACLEYAESLPADADELDSDDLTDYLIEKRNTQPEMAIDVVDAFFFLGEAE